MSAPTKSTAQLLELAKIISDSVQSIDRACTESGLAFPSLDDPFTPQSEAFRTNPEANEAANIIAAAAFQLVATVLPPPYSLISVVSGHFQTAALRVCLEGNVTEILREAGPNGLHVDDIAAKANYPSQKLGRLMRFLATQHVYKEIKPEVFTNTRLSSVLDTGKSVDEILANPSAKHDNTHGFPALLGHHFDEVPKSGVYLEEALADPVTGDSGEVTHTAFNRAFNTDSSLWDWYETPENEHRHKRFGMAMRGVAALQPPDAILSSYDWETLPKDSVVVDVGGGVGASSMPIAQKFDHLQLVVQDRPATVEEGKKIYSQKLPDALQSGRVKLEAHDFFNEQPIKNASVFLLKAILHDWSDSYCEKILKQLREAAQPDTKLVIVDSIVPYACRFPADDEDSAIPGSTPKEAPEPLLANYGLFNGLTYVADLTMMMMFNAQERTVKHLSALLKRTGWKLTEIKRPENANQFMQSALAVPA